MKKYEQYRSNLGVLSRASQEDLGNTFVQSGIINKFALQFELTWKLLKELLQYEGRREADTGSPRTVLKAAFSLYDCLEEEVWLSMLRERNNVTHIYDEAAAQRLVHTILNDYIPAFQTLETYLRREYGSLLEGD